jgi:hypothetical protein
MKSWPSTCQPVSLVALKTPLTYHVAESPAPFAALPLEKTIAMLAQLEDVNNVGIEFALYELVLTGARAGPAPLGSYVTRPRGCSRPCTVADPEYGGTVEFSVAKR